MPVPYIFSSMSASQGIPLADLDANFAYLASGGDQSLITAQTVSAFVGTEFPSTSLVVKINGYWTAGYGGLTVRRVASQPAHPWRFRSLDRYLPDGSVSSSNGGWWEGYTPNGAVTPEMFGAFGDGSSHPLSTKFSTLAAAQVYYPDAVALTDEIDWAAWYEALQYFRILGYITQFGTPYAYGGGCIECSGYYLINRTIENWVPNCKIIGVVSANNRVAVQGIQTATLQWNGPAGTVDAPVYILDTWIFNEFLQAPPGGPTAQVGVYGGGVTATIDGIVFKGLNHVLNSSTVPADTGFVSGLRFRQGSFVNVQNCCFSGCLWDGIVFTAPQLFTIITQNIFYGVLRDGVAILPFYNNFSTTTWIYRNEFGQVGRYAIFLDCAGAIEPTPIIHDNDIESTFNSYFVQNPAWYVGGVPTPLCFINCTGMEFRSNRTEGVAGYNGIVADMLILGCDIWHFTNNDVHVVYFADRSGSTAAFTSYINSNHYSDITNTRNYLLASTVVVGQFVAAANYNLNYLVACSAAEPTSFFDATGGCNLDGFFGAFQWVPVVSNNVNLAVPAATYGTGIANATLFQRSRFPLLSSFNTAATVATPLQQQLVLFSALTDSFRVGQGIDNVNETKVWNLFFRIGNPGTPGALGWNWPGYTGWTVNRLVNNSSAGFTLDDPLFWADWVNESGTWVQHYELAGAVITTKQIRENYTAAPVSGTWKQGDRVYFSNPTSGGFIGAVCTVGGTPGTWKNFGAIS